MKQRYTVLVEAGMAPKVADELRAKSVDVQQVLEQINVLTIQVDTDQLPTIRAMPDVVAIEPDRQVGIS